MSSMIRPEDSKEPEARTEKSKLQVLKGGYADQFPPVSYWRKLTAEMTDLGKQSDFAFDHIYPDPVRSLSALHWSRLAVVQKAVDLLVVNSKTRVLDVGSGGGKFCIVGALLSQAQFTGIERQAELARLSSELVEFYQVQRVSILHGKMEELDWSRFNAFYLYNPFHEFLLGSSQSFGRRQEQFRSYVQIVREKLISVPLGSRVVTYHGFGGAFPSGYVRVHREGVGSGDLELWIHRGR